MIPLNALGIGGGELTGIAKEFTTHTNRNAATNGHTRGAGSQSIGEDTRDTPLRVEVFHSLPQVQDQRPSLRGDQPHSGQRMRGPDGPRPLFSVSRSTTTDDLPEAMGEPSRHWENRRC